MKKSLLIRRFSQVSIVAAVAGLFGMAATQAQAVTLQWRDLNPTRGFISLDKLNTISSPQFFSAVINVGADNTITNGDQFTETLTLLTNSSSLGAGGAQNFAVGGDYRFEVTLSGDIENVVGAPITLNPDNSVTYYSAESKSDVKFTAGRIGLFDNASNTHITDLQFQSSGTVGLDLVAGSFIDDITINSVLGGASCTVANCDPYILDAAGNTLAGNGQELLTITTGSARVADGTVAGAPSPFDGSNFATNSLVVNFQDNGQSMTFVGQVPEPESYALMLAGLSLLGFAVAHRRKKLAN